MPGQVGGDGGPVVARCQQRRARLHQQRFRRPTGGLQGIAAAGERRQGLLDPAEALQRAHFEEAELIVQRIAPGRAADELEDARPASVGLFDRRQQDEHGAVVRQLFVQLARQIARRRQVAREVELHRPAPAQLR